MGVEPNSAASEATVINRYTMASYTDTETDTDRQRQRPATESNCALRGNNSSSSPEHHRPCRVFITAVTHITPLKTPGVEPGPLAPQASVHTVDTSFPCMHRHTHTRTTRCHQESNPKRRRASRSVTVTLWHQHTQHILPGGIQPPHPPYQDGVGTSNRGSAHTHTHTHTMPGR